MDIYDQIGRSFCQHRGSQAGVETVRKELAELGDDLRVVDLGCGDGLPIAEAVIAQCSSYTGVDSSSVMLEQFAENFPAARALLADLAELVLPAEQYDFIFSWGVIFHLQPDRQFAALGRAASFLRPAGRLLFTSGRESGSCSGYVGEYEIPHWSPGQAAYIDFLKSHEMVLLKTYDDPFENPVFLFEKQS